MRQWRRWRRCLRMQTRALRCGWTDTSHPLMSEFTPWTCDTGSVTKSLNVTLRRSTKKKKKKRRTCTSCIPDVVSRLAGLLGGTCPLVGGIWLCAAPRSGVVAIATVSLCAALPAAACPAGAWAVTAPPVRHIQNYPTVLLPHERCTIKKPLKWSLKPFVCAKIPKPWFPQTHENKIWVLFLFLLKSCVPARLTKLRW